MTWHLQDNLSTIEMVYFAYLNNIYKTERIYHWSPAYYSVDLQQLQIQLSWETVQNATMEAHTQGLYSGILPSYHW